eukprot:COSAG01_NODE_64861_length_275_cov_0.585227_1_plen_38_part_10
MSQGLRLAGAEGKQEGCAPGCMKVLRPRAASASSHTTI